MEKTRDQIAEVLPGITLSGDDTDDRKPLGAALTSAGISYQASDALPGPPRLTIVNKASPF
jgi:hypothetical protein